MRYLIFILMMLPIVARAQTSVEALPDVTSPRIVIPLAQTVMLAGSYAGITTIPGEDSTTVSIDGLRITDFAIVAYANRGPVLQAADEFTLGWAIWQDGALTIYGLAEATVSFLILKVQ